MAHTGVVSGTTKVTVFGNKRIVYGTFTLTDNETAGTVSTGLKTVEAFFMDGIIGWTASGGTVTVVTVDLGATVANVSFLAIGT